MALAGRATPEGTARYRDRMVARGIAPGHFRQVHGLWLSSIGLGTYLGDADDAGDERYREAAVLAARLGCNAFDTAINYRHQRSERALGEAFRRMEEEGVARRDEVVVATKGGYIPFDGAIPDDPRAYYLREFLAPGVFGPGEVVGGMHCMTPRYLDDQLRRSLGNLELEAVDIYYLHNPEGQMPEVARDELLRRLRAAFEMLEARADGQVGWYGTATWDGYRVPPGSPEHLDLHALLGIAREVGAGDHRFGFVQLPVNLAMPEAFLAPTQPVGGATLPLLDAAQRFGVPVMASASLLQRRLRSGLPPEVGEALPGLETDAQRAIQFVRSLPGVAVALVGMCRPEHVEENLALARIPPAPPEHLRRLTSGVRH